MNRFSAPRPTGRSLLLVGLLVMMCLLFPLSGCAAGRNPESHASSGMESGPQEASESESSFAEETSGFESGKDPEEEAGSSGSEDVKNEESQPEDAIEALLASMTLEEKVGQLFLVRYPGKNQAPAVVREYHVGGFVLFGVDFQGTNADGVREKLSMADAEAKIPLLFAVDEEGGTVVRVSSVFRDRRFEAPRELYSKGGFEAIEEETREKSALLLSLGLNMNLAPVCDLSDREEDFMYERAFSGDPKEVSEFVSRTVALCREAGLMSCLKHFPGYGNNVDSHTGMAYDEREREELYARDMEPFRAGIEAGAEAVMVSHNVVRGIDAENPASLSPAMHEILRRDLSFNGVIMTDDLAMGAITEFCGEVDAAVMAVLCGNDMLIVSEYEDSYAAVLEAVKDGTIEETLLNEAVRRILRMKAGFER